MCNIWQHRHTQTSGLDAARRRAAANRSFPAIVYIAAARRRTQPDLARTRNTNVTWVLDTGIEGYLQISSLCVFIYL